MRLQNRAHMSKPDARELTRLQLVALAAEVSTVVTRVQEETAFCHSDEWVAELASAEELQCEAMEILALETAFERIDTPSLHCKLAAFQIYQRKAILLRQTAATMLKQRAPRRTLRRAYFWDE